MAKHGVRFKPEQIVSLLRQIEVLTANGQCLLVIIGVLPNGTKERVVIGKGFAETKEAWADLLLDLIAINNAKACKLVGCYWGIFLYEIWLREVFQGGLSREVQICGPALIALSSNAKYCIYSHRTPVLWSYCQMFVYEP